MDYFNKDSREEKEAKKNPGGFPLGVTMIRNPNFLHEKGAPSTLYVKNTGSYIFTKWIH